MVPGLSANRHPARHQGPLGARLTHELPKLLRLLAARTSGELVLESLHSGSGLNRQTIDNYLGYLQMTYLLLLIPAWSRNLTSKAARRPKVHITDSGLSAFLLGKDPRSLARPTDPARGQLIESFVVNELHRQVSWHADPVSLHHFRDRGGREVDLIAEAADGRIVSVEVKSAPVVTQQDARHLRWLRDRVPNDFVCGVVLHTGERAYRLGDRLLAVPVSHVWTTQ